MMNGVCVCVQICIHANMQEYCTYKINNDCKNTMFDGMNLCAYIHMYVRIHNICINMRTYKVYIARFFFS